MQYFQCSERALALTNNKGVEPAMEWLIAHSDEMEPAPVENLPPSTASAPPAEPLEVTPTEDGATSSEPAQVAKSLKCDDWYANFFYHL